MGQTKTVRKKPEYRWDRTNNVVVALTRHSRCDACGSRYRLVIDHDRLGRRRRYPSRILCQSCNGRKGARKRMPTRTRGNERSQALAKAGHTHADLARTARVSYSMADKWIHYERTSPKCARAFQALAGPKAERLVGA